MVALHLSVIQFPDGVLHVAGIRELRDALSVPDVCEGHVTCCTEEIFEILPAGTLWHPCDDDAVLKTPTQSTTATFSSPIGATSHLHTDPLPIKVVAVTSTDGILGVAAVVEFYESEGRAVSAAFYGDVPDPPILPDE